jgi:hypothetical protein
MTKADLIRAALIELKKQWNVGEHHDWFNTLPDPGIMSDEVIVKWTPQTQNDSQGYFSPTKTVTISRKKDGRFHCVINDTASAFRGEKSIISDYCWYWKYTKLNREFEALRQKIVEYKRAKENNHFLEDLMKIFPQSFDGVLLGDDFNE